MNASPYSVWLQTHNSGDGTSTYPIALNPLGGKVGIGNANPSAVLDVTGDFAVSGASTLGGGTAITKIVSNSNTLNYGSISANGEATLTLTVSGASTSGTPTVALGWSAALEDGIVVKEAWVSGSNTVSVRVRNTTGSSIDPAAVTCRATVYQF